MDRYGTFSARPNIIQSTQKRMDVFRVFEPTWKECPVSGILDRTAYMSELVVINNNETIMKIFGTPYFDIDPARNSPVFCKYSDVAFVRMAFPCRRPRPIRRAHGERRLFRRPH